MEQWNFYLTGIQYGSFCLDDGQVRYQWLDPFTGIESEEKLFDQKKSDELKELVHLNILELLGRLEGYQSVLSGDAEHVTTPFGEIYTRRTHGIYTQRQVIKPHDIIIEDGKIAAFFCPHPESGAVLVRKGCEKYTILKQWKKAFGNEKIHTINSVKTFQVITRDGINLATDIYLPHEAPGKVPAILVRTPYNKSNNMQHLFPFVQRGYALVIQDVRGRDQSGGKFIPNYNEVEDGDDTLNWIAAQEWSDGKVGMIGGSYLGYVQWAAAASSNPHLCAMISEVTAGSAFVDFPRKGGGLMSGALAWCFLMSEQTEQPQLMARDDWDKVLDIRPLKNIAREALGHDIPFLNEWLSRSENDEFWQKTDWVKRSTGRQIPALIVSGWFDDNGMGTTQALELVHGYPKGKWKAVLGPWNHSYNTRYDIHGVHMGTEALRYDMDLLFVMWMDFHLKGIQNGIDATPAVEYFTISENRWKSAENWPIPQRRMLELYLDGNDQSAVNGNGILSIQVPAQGRNTYKYDPKDPAPHIIDVSENELSVPEDYTEAEKRPDILCYTTPTLERDITVTGDMEVLLYFSSDAVDTDFVVRITEVDQDGRSIKLADGILTAKYRDGFDSTSLLKSGEVYTIRIRTTKLSKCFKVGNRIRLQVTSSAKNLNFPNSNTINGFDSSETVIAHNTVYHGGIYPSRIVIPLEGYTERQIQDLGLARYYEGIL